jgi:hypothetical protein
MANDAGRLTMLDTNANISRHFRRISELRWKSISGRTRRNAQPHMSNSTCRKVMEYREVEGHGHAGKVAELIA